MPAGDYGDEYIFIRDKFIELAEDQHVVISPDLGRIKEASIGGVVYSEWSCDRGFQVAISHPDGPGEIDVVMTTLPYDQEELPLLKAFSINTNVNWFSLWHIRSLWLDDALDTKSAGLAVEKYLEEQRRDREV